MQPPATQLDPTHQNRIDIVAPTEMYGGYEHVSGTDAINLLKNPVNREYLQERCYPNLPVF